MIEYLSRVATLCLCLATAVACETPFGPNGAADAGSQEIAAEVNGRAITVGELDAFIKDELFAQKTAKGAAAKVYDLRSNSVQRMVDHRVVQEAADAAGITPEELLADEAKKIGDVTDAEVTAYFEEHSDQMRGATLEQIAPQIRKYLLQIRQGDILVGLREQAGTVLLLEAVRSEVEAVGPSLGPEDAPVTIVEFSDFQCPFCKRTLPTIHSLREQYPDQVRIIYRHLPLDSIHSRARPVAEAAACADVQGKFWEFHDLVFENNKKLSDDDLAGHASELGLEMDAYRQCVSERETQAIVQTDAAAAAGLGISGTPAFFVNGILLSGAKPFADFVKIIDAELARE
jgi:protein-disulfide isomerase